MNSALIVGDRGSGLTTFVGLLYTAQVRLGTEEADEFRFHADRETIRELEAIYGELGSGRFPARDVDWEEHPLSFSFGFRRSGLRSLAGGASDEEGGFGVVRVQVGGISTQELADLREHDAVLGESSRRLFRSQVIIPLIDASRLPRDPGESASTSLMRYDRQLAATLDLLGRFLSADRNRKARVMHLLFVLTKVDQCPPATMAGWGAPPTPSMNWPMEVRQKVGQAILSRALPATAQFLENTRKRGRGLIEPPQWFFSSLVVSGDENAPKIARRSRLPFGGWEPEYPFEEYRALIERIGWLGHRLPRPIEA
jgi:hypothetical protein